MTVAQQLDWKETKNGGFLERISQHAWEEILFSTFRFQDKIGIHVDIVMWK